MADNYDLALVREVAPEIVLRQIRDLVGGELTDAAELFIMPELWASVSAVDHPLRQEMYRETWGIDTRTSVRFGRGYKTDPDARRSATETMSIAAARLVRVLETDGGMTWEHDRKVMRSEGGVLYLYDWWPQWTEPSVRAQLPEPYVLTSDDPLV
jgi:hypothetical protein